MDPGVVWSAVGALGAVAAAVVAAWAARQSRISAEHANAAAETLATIERDRRHAELTPQFQVTVDDGGSGNRDRLVLLMRLTGPPGLDQLGGLTVRIRDDNYRRWVGELPVGATREQVENCIWGPYRLVPGLGSDDGRADKTGRFAQYDAALPIGEDVAYPIEVTQVPPWLHKSQQEWREYWKSGHRLGETILMTIEARVTGQSTWNLPYEIKLGPGRPVLLSWAPHNFRTTLT